MASVNVRAVYDIDPVDTWHSDSVVARSATPRTRCATTRARARTPRSWTPAASPSALAAAGSVKEALSPGTRQTRKPVTDELQRISRQGWTEDEVNDVFPGQKPAVPPAAHRA